MSPKSLDLAYPSATPQGPPSLQLSGPDCSSSHRMWYHMLSTCLIQNEEYSHENRRSSL